MNGAKSREQVVGILGGMGPEATVDLMQRIIRLTPATDDIDHIRCLVDNNPKVPSRIKAIIEGTGENPGPCLAQMAMGLESWGADFLVIACNTAHAYYDVIRDAVNIPVIHLIDLVVTHVQRTLPGIRRVGVLASIAVQMTGLYATRFQSAGIEVVYPEPVYQEELFQLIRRIKTGDTGEAVGSRYLSICSHIKSLGAETAVVACTELSILEPVNPPLGLIDAAELLAGEIVAVVRHGKSLS